MGRRFWLGFLPLIMGVVGLGQVAGTWTAELNILPDTELLRSSLSISYPLAADWLGTMVFKYAHPDTNELSLGLKGTIGPVYLGGEVYFDLFPPTYKRASASATFSWDAVTVTAQALHLPPGYHHSCPQTDSSYLEYTLQLQSDPWLAVTRFGDCSTGTSWIDTRLTLRGLDLCCGVVVKGELLLTKAEGFKRARVEFQNLTFPCPDCGFPELSFDLSISFTPTEKSLTLRPKLGFPQDACVTVYGNVDFSGMSLKGLEIYGFEIGCAFGDCTSVRFKTAFHPGTLGFSGDEFEYVRFSFCLPGCCGDEGKLEFTPYFSTTGGSFGLSRLVAKAWIPLIDGVMVEGELELPASGDPKLATKVTVAF